MSEFQFKRAHRSGALLRLMLNAVSGAGKTYSALRLARGIVDYYIAHGMATPGYEGKIGFIDSERNSAKLFSHIVPFDHLSLNPPYSVDRYNQALHAAEQTGFLICIVDQISHAWAGQGGQLEWVDALKAGGAKHVSPWATVTPVQQEFYDRMLRSSMHLIVTTRSKTEWVIDDVTDDRGNKKRVPRKIGLAPVQRDGLEYEFTTALDIDVESHMARSTKDRTQLFDGRVLLLDETVGQELAKWLIEGADGSPLPAETLSTAAPPTVSPGSAGTASETRSPAAGSADGTPIEQIEDATSDYELKFLEVSTLPDLASLFDAGQKRVRAFVATLGAPTVKPFLDRLVKAKDMRKEALETVGPDGERVTNAGTTQVADTARTADGVQALPPSNHPASASAPKYVTPDDAAQLKSICIAQGLTPLEGLKALGAERFSQVLLSTFAASVDLLKLAGKQKLERAEPKGRRSRAAV